MFSHKMRVCTAFGFVVVLLFGAQTAVAQSSTEGQQQSLYDRLGGLAPISVVVSDLLDAVVPDPFLNENPAVDAARTRVPTPYLKFHLTAMVCQAAGGPCQYGGRGMVETHAQLYITEADGDAWSSFSRKFSQSIVSQRRRLRSFLTLSARRKLIS